MDKINIEENELKKLFDMIGLKKKMFFAFHASRELTVRISTSFLPSLHCEFLDTDRKSMNNR